MVTGHVRAQEGRPEAETFYYTLPWTYIVARRR
jgi:hypothetical protein